MTTKHTPGPWHWDSDPVKGDPLGRVRYRICTLGKTITQTYSYITQTYYSSSDAQAEWDARLIACAPELLAACEAAAEEFRQFMPTTAGSTLTMLEAVIRKATGETGD